MRRCDRLCLWLSAEEFGIEGDDARYADELPLCTAVSEAASTVSIFETSKDGAEGEYAKGRFSLRGPPLAARPSGRRPPAAPGKGRTLKGGVTAL